MDHLRPKRKPPKVWLLSKESCGNKRNGTVPRFRRRARNEMRDDYTRQELRALCSDDLEVVAVALEKQDRPAEAKRVRQSFEYQRQQLGKEWAMFTKALYRSLPGWLRKRLEK